MVGLMLFFLRYIVLLMKYSAFKFYWLVYCILASLYHKKGNSVPKLAVLMYRVKIESVGLRLLLIHRQILCMSFFSCVYLY